MFPAASICTLSPAWLYIRTLASGSGLGLAAGCSMISRYPSLAFAVKLKVRFQPNGRNGEVCAGGQSDSVSDASLFAKFGAVTDPAWLQSFGGQPVAEVFP